MLSRMWHGDGLLALETVVLVAHNWDRRTSLLYPSSASSSRCMLCSQVLPDILGEEKKSTRAFDRSGLIWLGETSYHRGMVVDHDTLSAGMCIDLSIANRMNHNPYDQKWHAKSGQIDLQNTVYHFQAKVGSNNVSMSL